MTYTNWRQDPGLDPRIIYKKRFALKPVQCSCGEKIWLKYYYKKYEQWSQGNTSFSVAGYSHTDFIENITEADYIIRKLAETL